MNLSSSALKAVPLAFRQIILFASHLQTLNMCFMLDSQVDMPFSKPFAILTKSALYNFEHYLAFLAELILNHELFTTSCFFCFFFHKNHILITHQRVLEALFLTGFRNVILCKTFID